MNQLPPEFVDLEPFVATWALPTEDARSRARWNASPAQFQRFYDAMQPRLDAALACIDRYDIGAMPPPVYTLYLLAIALAEIAPHVELYKGAAQVPNSFLAERFNAGHGEVTER